MGGIPHEHQPTVGPAGAVDPDHLVD
jgi:hypothetical protein